jgi:hypothetical protein
LSILGLMLRASDKLTLQSFKVEVDTP